MTNTGTINIASGALVSIAFTVLDLEPGTVLAGAGALQIFSTGTSNVNLPLTVPSGFTFRLASNTLAGSGSIAVDGIFDFFGGTLSVPTTINSTGSMITSDASAKNLNTNLVVDGTFTWTLGSFTLTSAAITINGSMVANLASSQFINSSVAGSSLTISNGATLSKTSTAASTFTSNISITNNGIMSGIGTLNFTGANGPIVNAGEVRPGNSPGILGLNANLITGQTPTLRIEILGPASTAGVDFDQLTFNTGAAMMYQAPH
ncbi:MAG: hypothetical protein IPN29_01580 [Saprospiraceae bacterium]|nr:hypothetical protein [Saprospiraceae bacterium]